MILPRIYIYIYIYKKLSCVSQKMTLIIFYFNLAQAYVTSTGEQRFISVRFLASKIEISRYTSEKQSFLRKQEQSNLLLRPATKHDVEFRVVSCSPLNFGPRIRSEFLFRRVLALVD